MESITEELEALYDQSGPSLYRCALAVTGCGGLAEDAVHNAFHRVLRGRVRPDNLKAYMYRSVRNAAIDLMRKNARTVPVTPDALFELAAAEDANVVLREMLEQVTQIMATLLTVDERETVMLYLTADLTFEEIATLRGRPMGTVTSWYRRGLRKIREGIQHETG